MAFREVGFEDALALGRRGIAHRRNPFAVGAWHGCAGAATAPPGAAAPASSFARGCSAGLGSCPERPDRRYSVRPPAVKRRRLSSVHCGSARVGALGAHPALGRRAIAGNKPDLARVPVRFFDARADGEGNPPAVGREHGRADGLDAVIVLDRERAAAGPRSAGRLCSNLRFGG